MAFNSTSIVHNYYGNPVLQNTDNYMLSCKYCRIYDNSSAFRFCIWCHFCHTKKLYESETKSKSSSIFLWKGTVQPIQSFLELNKFLTITLVEIPLNIQRLNCVQTDWYLWISCCVMVLRKTTLISVKEIFMIKGT